VRRFDRLDLTLSVYSDKAQALRLPEMDNSLLRYCVEAVVEVD